VFILLQSIAGAADAEKASIQHVGVDHGGLDIVVVDHFLNRANVMATFK